MTISSVANGYRRILGIVFLFIMAAILLAAGVIMTGNAKKEYKETQAVIAEIITERIGEDYTHYVYVDYEVDGVKYSHVSYSGYEDSFAEGQTITVLYEAEHPEITGTATPSWLKYAAFAAAGVFFIAGCVAVVFAVRSSRKGKSMATAPLITEDGREIGTPRKLYFSTDPKAHVKLHFYLEDECKNVLYEAKMTKHGLLGAHTYLFTDHIGHTETEHKVGLVNSAESGGWKVSQGFTFDGVDMYRFFEANNITVSYGLDGVAMTVSIYHKGNLIANAVMSSMYVHEEDAEKHPVGSKLRFNQFYYRIEGQMSYSDVIFLVLFKEALSPRADSLL